MKKPPSKKPTTPPKPPTPLQLAMIEANARIRSMEAELMIEHGPAVTSLNTAAGPMSWLELRLKEKEDQ